jgi:hypothetical protein
MKRAHLFGLYAGCAWAAYILARTAVNPTKHIVGEGEFIFVVAAAPLIFIGFIQSLFISIPSRLPAYYAAAIASTFIGLFLVYRLHLGFTSHDVRPAILTPLVAAIAFLISAGIFYTPPAVKYVYHRAICRTKNT